MCTDYAVALNALLPHWSVVWRVGSLGHRTCSRRRAAEVQDGDDQRATPLRRLAKGDAGDGKLPGSVLYVAEFQ